MAGAVTLRPGDNIQNVVDSHPAGTTYFLTKGVYRRQSIVPKAGDRFIGEPGATLTGENVTAYAFTGQRNNVTIEGLIIERYNTGAEQSAIQSQATGWIIRNNEIRENSSGALAFRSGWQVLNNYIHHNHRFGIRGFGSGALVQGNEIAFNNYLRNFEPNAAGGSKFIGTQDLVVRDNYVHSNHGPGLWTDGDNIRTLYDRNRVVNNFGPGIFHEISYSAKVTGNYVEGNALGFHLAGILIANSSGVEVTGNTLVNNDGGIIGVDVDRGSGAYGARTVRDLWVHGNTVSYREGYSGIRVNGGDSSILQNGNNRFEGNTYRLGSMPTPFQWGSGMLTITQWQSTGNDLNSTFS